MDNTTARRRRGVVLPTSGWAVRRTASSGRHRTSPSRQRRRPLPLVLEDQLVSSATASCPPTGPHRHPRRRRRQGRLNWDQRAKKALAAGDTRATRCAGGRQRAAGDTIIDDCWMAGDDKEGSRQEQTTTNHCAQRVTKRGRTMPTRRTSKEEEDYDNNEEEDCAAAAATAATAAATAATTTGPQASSAATASDQVVAAVAAAQSSSLRWGAVAAVADSRMPLLSPDFFVSS
jgi:hypothetical protein